MRIDNAVSRQFNAAYAKCCCEQKPENSLPEKSTAVDARDSVTISDASRSALKKRSEHLRRRRLANADEVENCDTKHYKRLRHYAEKNPVVKRIMNHYNDWLGENEGAEKGLESFERYLGEHPKVARYSSAHTAFFEHLLG